MKLCQIIKLNVIDPSSLAQMGMALDETQQI
jgi:hypothetical protein